MITYFLSINVDDRDVWSLFFSRIKFTSSKLSCLYISNWTGHMLNVKDYRLPKIQLFDEVSFGYCNTEASCKRHWFSIYFCPVSESFRIHQLHLGRGVWFPQRMSWHDTKQSDGEVPVILKLWRMQNTPSLQSLPGPLWPGVIAPDRVLSMGQIELNYILMLS